MLSKVVQNSHETKTVYRRSRKHLTLKRHIAYPNSSSNICVIKIL